MRGVGRTKGLLWLYSVRRRARIPKLLFRSPCHNAFFHFYLFISYVRTKIFLCPDRSKIDNMFCITKKKLGSRKFLKEIIACSKFKFQFIKFGRNFKKHVLFSRTGSLILDIFGGTLFI